METIEEFDFKWSIDFEESDFPWSNDSVGFMPSRVIESEKLVSPKSFPSQFQVQVTIIPSGRSRIYFCKFYLLKCRNERIPRNMYLQARLNILNHKEFETKELALEDRNLLHTCYLNHLCGPIFICFKFLSDSSSRTSLIQKHSCLADLKSLYESKEMADVTINIGKESLKAHKLILAARSPVFKAAFSNGFLESQTNCIEIPDIDAHTMDCFLKYLYYGDIGNDVSVDTICRIYQLANEKQVVDLREYCSYVMAAETSPDNVLNIVVLADLHNDASLKRMAVQYIVRHLQEIMLQNAWPEFSKNHPALFKEVLGLN